MRKINLNNGYASIVDDENYEYLNQWKWYAKKSQGGNIYAVRNLPRPQSGLERMHRVVVEVPLGMFIDHINGDGLDNRKCNLRVCTKQQNSKNMKGHSSSGIKGAHTRRDITKVSCRIRWEKHSLHLGYYNYVEEAGMAYDVVARFLYQDFARLNYPEKDFSKSKAEWKRILDNRLVSLKLSGKISSDISGVLSVGVPE